MGVEICISILFPLQHPLFELTRRLRTTTGMAKRALDYSIQIYVGLELFYRQRLSSPGRQPLSRAYDYHHHHCLKWRNRVPLRYLFFLSRQPSTDRHQ